MRTAFKLPDGVLSGGVNDARNGVVFDDRGGQDTMRLAVLEVREWQKRLVSSRRRRKTLLRYG